MRKRWEGGPKLARMAFRAGRRGDPARRRFGAREPSE
jgi:hypothetical protein